MKKNRIFWMFAILMLAISMSSCSNDGSTSVDNPVVEVGLKNFANSGCKVNTRSGSDDRKEFVEYSVLHEGYLYVNHQNAIFNCCPEGLGADVRIEEDKITSGEYETGGDCDCICPYDLSYEIGPLIEGRTYTIFIGHKGLEPKVAEFTFRNSMSGIWEFTQ